LIHLGIGKVEDLGNHFPPMVIGKGKPCHLKD
jgi:hypothetical protein